MKLRSSGSWKGHGRNLPCLHERRETNPLPTKMDRSKPKEERVSHLMQSLKRAAVGAHNSTKASCQDGGGGDGSHSAPCGVTQPR